MTWFVSKTWGGCTLLLAALSWAVPASAQKTDGKVQLGLSAPLAGYHKYTLEEPGVDTEVSGIVWGLPGTENALGESVVSFELGYGVGKMVVPGLVFRAEGSSVTVDPDGLNNEDRQSFGLAIGPKLDLVMSSGEEIRPFLGIAGGYITRSTSADVENAPNRDSSITGYFVTGRFGLHVFATKSFSIDPALVFNYRKTEETADEGVDVVDIERTRSGWDVGLALGISGWI